MKSSTEYTVKIVGKDNRMNTVSANDLGELLSKIELLGYGIDSEKEELVDWLSHAYPTCKLFLENCSIQCLGNTRIATGFSDFMRTPEVKEECVCGRQFRVLHNLN